MFEQHNLQAQLETAKANLQHSLRRREEAGSELIRHLADLEVFIYGCMIEDLERELQEL